MRCTECGSEMRFTSEPIKEKYKGEELTVNGTSRWVCDKCGNDVMDASEADRLGRKLANAYATSNGLLSPDEIRELRKSLGMGQKDFERLLGVSSPTVSRWETGSVQQSKPVDNLMRVIRAVPEARRLLLEKAETQYKSSAYSTEISVGGKSGRVFQSFTTSDRKNVIEFKTGCSSNPLQEVKEA